MKGVEWIKRKTSVLIVWFTSEETCFVFFLLLNIVDEGLQGLLGGEKESLTWERSSLCRRRVVICDGDRVREREELEEHNQHIRYTWPPNLLTPLICGYIRTWSMQYNSHKLEMSYNKFNKHNCIKFSLIWFDISWLRVKKIYYLGCIRLR